MKTLKTFVQTWDRLIPGGIATDAGDAMQRLAAAGAAADKLLVEAESTSALATEGEAAQIEELVQTLGALSREIWAAHAAARKAIKACQQLDRVEKTLAERAGA